MKEFINPAEFDHVGVIVTGSGSNTNGQVIKSYSSTYTSVKSKKLAPLKYEASEISNNSQDVFIERLSWLIRKEDRSIVPNSMVYIVDSKAHFIKNVRAYKGSRNLLVLDTEYQDNNPTVSYS